MAAAPATLAILLWCLIAAPAANAALMRLDFESRFTFDGSTPRFTGYFVFDTSTEDSSEFRFDATWDGALRDAAFTFFDSSFMPGDLPLGRYSGPVVPAPVSASTTAIPSVDLTVPAAGLQTPADPSFTLSIRYLGRFDLTVDPAGADFIADPLALFPTELALWQSATDQLLQLRALDAETGEVLRDGITPVISESEIRLTGLTPVPLPAGVLLLGSVLLALGWRRRAGSARQIG